MCAARGHQRSAHSSPGTAERHLWLQNSCDEVHSGNLVCGERIHGLGALDCGCRERHVPGDRAEDNTPMVGVGDFFRTTRCRDRTFLRLLGSSLRLEIFERDGVVHS